LKAAERFRRAIEKKENQYNELKIKVTISLGVSELREEMVSPEVMMKKADDALYRAKHEGRNRVEIMD
jgi:diguanylate cyclase (GGDEF)-like protein